VEPITISINYKMTLSEWEILRDSVEAGLVEHRSKLRREDLKIISDEIAFVLGEHYVEPMVTYGEWEERRRTYPDDPAQCD
jgi:hypothetical protein